MDLRRKPNGTDIIIPSNGKSLHMKAAVILNPNVIETQGIPDP
jgi:hypothetical protein